MCKLLQFKWMSLESEKGKERRINKFFMKIFYLQTKIEHDST